MEGGRGGVERRRIKVWRGREDRVWKEGERVRIKVWKEEEGGVIEVWKVGGGGGGGFMKGEAERRERSGLRR